MVATVPIHTFLSSSTKRQKGHRPFFSRPLTSSAERSVNALGRSFHVCAVRACVYWLVARSHTARSALGDLLCAPLPSARPPASLLSPSLLSLNTRAVCSPNRPAATHFNSPQWPCKLIDFVLSLSRSSIFPSLLIQLSLTDSDFVVSREKWMCRRKRCLSIWCETEACYDSAFRNEKLII